MRTCPIPVNLSVWDRNEERKRQINKSAKQRRRHYRADHVIEHDRWWRHTQTRNGDGCSNELEEEREYEEIHIPEEEMMNTSRSMNRGKKMSAATAAASSSSSSSSSSSISPAILNALNIHSSIECYIHEFITAAAITGKKLNPDKLINKSPTKKKQSILKVNDMTDRRRKELNRRELKAKYNQPTFLGKLLYSFDALDQKDKLTDKMWRPYLNELRSLIHRASPTEQLYQYEGDPCTLIEFILLMWSINNRQHLAYECLLAALSTPAAGVSVVGQPMQILCQDSFIRNDLVFYTFIQSGHLKRERLVTALMSTQQACVHREVGSEVNPHSDMIKLLIHEIANRGAPKDQLMCLLSHDYVMEMYEMIFERHPAIKDLIKKRKKNQQCVKHLDGASASAKSMETEEKTDQEKNQSEHDHVQQFHDYASTDEIRVFRMILDHWMDEVRPRLLGQILSSTTLVSANLCLQYIDGSEEVTRSTLTPIELKAMHSFNTAVSIPSSSIQSSITSNSINSSSNNVVTTAAMEEDFTLPSSWSITVTSTAACFASAVRVQSSSRSRTTSSAKSKKSSAAVGKRSRAKSKQQTSSKDEMEDDDEDEKGVDSDIEETSRSKKKRKMKI